MKALLIMMSLAGIKIDVPTEAPSSGPITFYVDMVADMETYYANNGILDKALNIVCVRRDYPGVYFVPKIDPHAHLLPESTLPQPETAEEMQGVVGEKSELNMIGYGAEHEGAADYFVFAAFAKWLSQPEKLSVVNRQRSLPAVEISLATPLIKEEVEKLPKPPDLDGVLASIVGEKELRIDGSLRVAKKPPRFPNDPPPPVFVTITAVRLVPVGGVYARSFQLKPETRGNVHVARFAIPLKDIAPQWEPGPYRILVFSADEIAAPIDIVIPEH